MARSVESRHHPRCPAPRATPAPDTPLRSAAGADPQPRAEISRQHPAEAPGIHPPEIPVNDPGSHRSVRPARPTQRREATRHCEQREAIQGRRAAFRTWRFPGLLHCVRNDETYLKTRPGAAISAPWPPPRFSPFRCRADLRRYAADHPRRPHHRPRRPDLPRRPQRLGQVDADEDRRRARGAGQGAPLRPAGHDDPLPRAGAGFLGFSTTLDFVEAGLAPGDPVHRARYLLESLGMTARRIPPNSRRRGPPRGARPCARTRARRAAPR